MKKTYLNYIVIMTGLLYLNSFASNAQDKKPLLYDMNADAKEVLKNAIEKADKEGKNVLIQVGGNWCKWCIKFHEFIKNDKQIDSLINADYVFILVNYSKENKNLEVMKQLEFPQRFGFPVFVVLDAKGKRMHTQDSGLLESGSDSYSREKIITFLKNWNRNALNPKNYITK
jgi:thioredoxin-related protein